jgi:Holliday junction resolvase RusA-like endonuclease
MSALEVVVHGRPVAQGSLVRNPGRGVRPDNAKALLPWRNAVSSAAYEAMGDRPILVGPVRLEVAFTFARPRGHYGTGRNARALRASAPAAPTTNPDLDKLVRAVCDALTGVVFRDDSQVVEVEATKRYGEPAMRAYVSEWQPDLPALFRTQ